MMLQLRLLGGIKLKNIKILTQFKQEDKQFL